MRGSILLGRFGNTDIGMHITFIPIIVWAAWIGSVHYGGVNGAAFGALAVSLLFVCVLIHELAHGLYARTQGIEVRYIVLLPIGGLASLDTSLASPHTEAKIALIGPFANMILGFTLGLLVFRIAAINGFNAADLMTHSLDSPSVAGLLAYLTVANFGLAFFNLLPAFPLDGGRALRAILSLHMPYETATHRAVILGRSFGAGLAAVGISITLLGWVYYGVALLLVAVVLYSGATYEDRIVQRYATLRVWTVEQVLQSPIRTAAPHDTLVSVLNEVIRGLVVPVMVGDRLIGLVTSSDLSSMTFGKPISDLSVAHVMRTRFPSVRLSDPLWVAYEKLQRSRLNAIPVVSQGNFSGLVTLTDIHRTLRRGQRPNDVG